MCPPRSVQAAALAPAPMPLAEVGAAVLGALAAAFVPVVRAAVRDEVRAALAELRDDGREVDAGAAARALRVSRAAIRARVQRGTLPGRRVGRRLLVPVRAVRDAGGDL